MGIDLKVKTKIMPDPEPGKSNFCLCSTVSFPERRRIKMPKQGDLTQTEENGEIATNYVTMCIKWNRTELTFYDYKGHGYDRNTCSDPISENQSIRQIKMEMLERHHGVELLLQNLYRKGEPVQEKKVEGKKA